MSNLADSLYESLDDLSDSPYDDLSDSPYESVDDLHATMATFVSHSNHNRSPVELHAAKLLVC